jgi:hypothetical protein
LTLAFAVVVATGCGHGRQSTRPYAAPTADALLAGLRARQAAVKSASLGTRTTSWLGGERVRGSVLMLVDRAGRLRFEAEVALRGTVATLVTDGGQFALLDGESNTFKRGPACPDNVASLVRIPLAPDEIAAVLLGDAPLGDDARADAEVAWDPDAAADVLTIGRRAQGGAAARLLVKVQAANGPLRVVGVEGESPGARGRWRVAYDDFDVVDGQPFPNRIRFAEPGRSYDQGVEIKIRDRSVNPKVPGTVFTMEPPSGARLVYVPCTGGTPP